MSDARLYDANAWHAIRSDHGKLMNAVKHSGCLGVPPPQMQAGSGFPLQVLASLVPRAAVGFPLQSFTRIAATGLVSKAAQIVEITFVRERTIR